MTDVAGGSSRSISLREAALREAVLQEAVAGAAATPRRTPASMRPVRGGARSGRGAFRPAQVLVHIDKSQGDSLQRQICEGLRRDIAGGVLGPGTRLPSSRQLARDLAVSRVTTTAAYEQLEAEGYIAGRRGS